MLTLSLHTQPQYYTNNIPNATNNAFPFNSNGATGKTTQTLYLPGAFNQPTPVPSGEITKIYFQASTTASATYTQLIIKMGLTTDVDLPTGAWYTTQMTTVFDENSYTLSGTVGQFSGITLETPFYYDSTKSLVVEVTQCGYSGTGINIYYDILSGIKRSAGPLAVTSCPHPWGNQNNYLTHTGIDVNTTVGIEPVGNEIPKGYSLDQNYPNPFNPSTKINFSIPTGGFTSLVIYDVMGREVMTLINSELRAGKYSFEFNADDLTSGAYIYKLNVNDFSETRKMIVIK
jgi:hypothetical protein